MIEEKRPFYKRSWFVILSLIMFFPLGLFLMWKFKKFNVAIRIVITTILSIGLIGSMFGEPYEEESVTKNDNEKIKEVVQNNKQDEENGKVKEAVKKESDEERITNIIHKTIGKRSLGNGEDRIIEITINENLGTDNPEDKIVLLNLMADEGFTKNSMKSRLLMNYAKVAEKIFEDEKVSELVIFWEFPLVDVYGNSENGVIVKIMLTKETADSINWDNFNSDNLPIIADDYFEHQSDYVTMKSII